MTLIQREWQKGMSCRYTGAYNGYKNLRRYPRLITKARWAILIRLLALCFHPAVSRISQELLEKSNRKDTSLYYLSLISHANRIFYNTQIAYLTRSPDLIRFLP